MPKETAMSPIVCVLFFCLLATSQAAPCEICNEDSDCDRGKCCQILNPYPVASKRRQSADLIIQPLPQSGTCQPYLTEGEFCNPISIHNGYCGCAPGLECHYEPLSTADESEYRSPAKRLLLPGTYSCEKK